MSQWINLAYLLASILFILGLKGLSSPKSAPRGNLLGALGMGVAVLATLLDRNIIDYTWILGGIVVGAAIGALMARTVQMTAMPQVVALFNGFGGGASLLVASAAYLEVEHVLRQGGMPPSVDLPWVIALEFSTLIGAVTLTGSLIAFGKLQGWVTEKALTFPFQKGIMMLMALGVIGLGSVFAMEITQSQFFFALVGLALVLGILLVIAIGGADMPVVIALLNSYSGLAAASTGFVLQNNGLIICGSLVGASGIILTNIMCKAMNRSLVNVLFGGAISKAQGGEVSKAESDSFYEGKIKQAGPEEIAMILETAQSVIFVPGYGLAVAQAQHVTRELADWLMNHDIQVRYAIHPVAGRMPGHMNVLLAEAEVDYEQMVEMDLINPEFSNTDVVIVLGANDVTNPAARDETSSPIYGMPILEVDHAKTVVVVKRSLSPGFAGIPNALFTNDNTLMLFGDAKSVLQQLITALQEF